MPLAALLIAASLLTAQTDTKEADAFDRETVQRNLGSTDDAALLRFLKLRTLSEADLQKLQTNLRRLGDADAKVRDEARAAILQHGASALLALRQMPKDLAPAATQEAAALAKKIESANESNVAISVLRLLASRTSLRERTAAVLPYVPFAENESVEEAALRCLGKSLRTPEGIAPEILAGAKASDTKIRGACAYVLGRYGELEQRETVRRMAADAAPEVRKRALEGLAGKRIVMQSADLTVQDQALLKTQQVGIEAKDVLEWMRARTLSEAALAKLKQRAADLGSPDFKVRNKAMRDLIKEGNVVIPFVQPFLDDGNAEVRRRAHQIIDEIRLGPGPALPAAALRQIARVGKSPEAVQVLLAYLPFIDDPQNVDEAIGSLTLLAAGDPAADALLLESMKDPLAARRAAVALVLGRLGSKDILEKVRQTLGDGDALVRVRGAQGLIAARDSSGIAALVGQIPTVPGAVLWQVEDELHRLAGPDAPPEPWGETASDQRKKAGKAWETWANAHAKSLDLRLLGDEGPLGLFVVCEHDTPRGAGRVSEFDRTGRVRWSLEGLAGPMDAQVLPNGNILVAENSANRVAEYDLQKRIVWEHRLQSNPVNTQRLPNGNTFIGCYNLVTEVTPDKKVLYAHNPGPGFYCFSAQKLSDGTIVCMTAQGMVQEIDSATGNIKRSFRLPQPGGWGSAQALPNGKFLAATMVSNQVQEMDATGAVLWKLPFQGVFRASRLPNGNTLAVSMTTRKVAELDRNGQTAWEKVMEGRPWSVRYR